MPSIFSKIVAGQIPCYKVAENEKFLAFLDAFPLKKGHTLIIPKHETDYVFDIETTDYLELMAFTKHIALAIKKTIACNRISMHVIGLEVPHTHIHLIPINTTNDCNLILKLHKHITLVTRLATKNDVTMWLIKK
jgi:histidine triad (HIT) family protein